MVACVCCSTPALPPAPDAVSATATGSCVRPGLQAWSAGRPASGWRCSGAEIVRLVDVARCVSHAGLAEAPPCCPSHSSDPVSVAGWMMPLGWSLHVLSAVPGPVGCAPQKPAVPGPVVCNTVEVPAAFGDIMQTLTLTKASLPTMTSATCCVSWPSDAYYAKTSCTVAPAGGEGGVSFGRALWLHISPGIMADGGLSADVDDFCLQTTPAGLVGHYRLDLTVASAAPGVEPARGHAEIQRDAATDTWTLHVTDVPAAGGWQLADQDAAALSVGDGFLDFALAFANAATGETTTVAVHLDSVASRLDGSFAPAGGAAAAGPVGTLVLRACVNEDYPGPC